MFRIARRIFRHRGLLVILTRRELQARYRGSFFGYLWSLANPILLLIVYSFVFSTIFQPRDSNVSPYPLFLAVGVFPWMWISTSWTEGTGSLLANAGLLRKTAFPAELLPIVSVFTNMVHFSFAFPVIIGALWIFSYKGYEVGGLSILLAPLIVLLQLPFVSGLTLGFAALNVYFKDIKDILGNMLTFLFFASPILYTIKTLEGYKWAYWVVKSNPMSPFFVSYHEAIFYGRVPDPNLWIRMLVISTVVWALGAWTFDRLGDSLAEAV